MGGVGGKILSCFFGTAVNWKPLFLLIKRSIPFPLERRRLRYFMITSCMANFRAFMHSSCHPGQKVTLLKTRLKSQTRGEPVVQFFLIRENHHTLKKKNRLDCSNHKQTLKIKPNIQKAQSHNFMLHFVTDWPGPQTYWRLCEQQLPGWPSSCFIWVKLPLTSAGARFVPNKIKNPREKITAHDSCM